MALLKLSLLEQPGWLSGLALPLAQGVILEIRDRVPHRPASPSACVSASLSLCLSLINKKIFKKINKIKIKKSH